MDNRNDLREFLATRRAKIRPEQTGLPARADGTPMKPRRRPVQHRIRPSVQFALDAITDAPAFVRNGRRDILAANRLGYALNSERYIGPVRPANHARWTFEAMDLSAGTGESLPIYPAEPASADALRLLASRGEQSRATAAASEGA